jgi:hypothetical protein
MRFSMAAWLGALLALSAPLGSAAYAAEQRALDDAVRVTPGATCLRADKLIEDIAHRLGGSELDADLSIEVRGSPSFARFVEVQLKRAGTTEAERRFEPGPAACEDLHAALGLAIALAIKASLREAQGEEASAAPRGSARAWQLGANGLVGLMVPPGAAYGADLRLARAFTRRIAGRLAVFGLWNPERTFAQTAGRFDVWLVGGRAEACAAPALWAHASLSACLGLSFGGILARGEAFAPSASASRRLLGLASALEFAFDLTPAWSLSLAVSVLVPFERTSFVVRDSAGSVVDARDLSVVGGFVSFGPAYNF